MRAAQAIGRAGGAGTPDGGLGVKHRPSRRAARNAGVLVASGLAVLLVGAGCVSPAQRFSEQAVALGMRVDRVAGTAFQHAVFQQRRRASRTLHVYIGGDGTPWSVGGPAEDPTPREPLLLRLMALDANPSVYLGRPCYHGLAHIPPCSSPLWTWDRYSETVVSSMAAALRRILAEGEYDRVAWFGYSGGGSLTLLLAPRFAETSAVVTVAANLDIDAWADYHGYPRLAGSLNPAKQPPLPAWIHQRHYVGSDDHVVPKDIVARAPIPPNTLVVVPKYTHRCCWVEIWPAVLDELERSAGSGR